MCGDNLSGKKKYTDGKIAKYFFPGEQPEGWILGSTEEKKLKNSIAQKKVWESDEYRQKVDKYYHGDEYNEKRSDRANKSWENYEQKCKNIKIAQKKRWTVEEREKQSKRMIEKWKDEDYHSS